MRRRLRETRQELSIWQAIRNLRWDVENILWRLRGANSSAAVEVGGGGIPLYFGTSRADLQEKHPDVEAHALGFITSGDTQGAWYERNAANTLWVGRTIWEVPE